MGGAKKPTAAKKEKQVGPKGDSKKPKKDRAEGAPKKVVVNVVINEENAMNVISGAKVVTVHGLARQTGVRVSTANSFLRKLVEKGTVKTVGGYSGHRLYQAA